jgi:hypothetical protein
LLDIEPSDAYAEHDSFDIEPFLEPEEPVQMFGMMPATAMELEAERRRELATAWKPVPTVRPDSVREPRPAGSLRRLLGSFNRTPPAGWSGWEDVRT